MNTPLPRTFRSARLAGVLLLSLPLIACGNAAEQARQHTDSVQAEVANAMRDANQQVGTAMATHNITLQARDGSSVPKAEISPAGDLLVDGKAVPLDASQRKLTLAYRGQLLGLVQAGVGIGTDAAAIATRAASGAIASVFGGDTNKFEADMDAAGKQIQARAMELCDRMPALRQSQDALAAAVPAFRPYARMDDSDEIECRKDAADAKQQVHDAGKEASASIHEARATAAEAATTAQEAATTARDAGAAASGH